MTGQDIQDRVDAIVQDLQTTYKGATVDIAVRYEDNVTGIRQLSSDVNGNINAGQLASLNAVLAEMKTYADGYDLEYADVSAASEAYREALKPHAALATAATAARKAYNDAIEADGAVQAAKLAYDNARLDVDYINARDLYRTYNVSENYGNLGDARGKYVLPQA